MVSPVCMAYSPHSKELATERYQPAFGRFHALQRKTLSEPGRAAPDRADTTLL
jgi:hypothetical protein